MFFFSLHVIQISRTSLFLCLYLRLGIGSFRVLLKKNNYPRLYLPIIFSFFFVLEFLLQSLLIHGIYSVVVAVDPLGCTIHWSVLIVVFQELTNPVLYIHTFLSFSPHHHHYHHSRPLATVSTLIHSATRALRRKIPHSCTRKVVITCLPTFIPSPPFFFSLITNGRSRFSD